MNCLRDVGFATVRLLPHAARLLVLGGLASAMTACGGGGGGGGDSAPNSAPTAVISANPTSGKAPLTVALDGAGSSDRDGSISSYRWTYSDGAAAATTSTTTRTFSNPGNFTVTLTVTDNRGATGTATASINVSANVAPTASFTATPTSGKAPLAVVFDGSASADPDGSIASYAWAFGDGGTASGATAAYTYVAPGTYTARLTVTDDSGATATTTATVRVLANTPPTAAFTATPTSGRAPLAVSFDGQASVDPDGTIASYQWDFGDGNVGSGATATNTYTTGGTFTARLTVTDNQGATGTTTRTLTIAPPVGNVMLVVQDNNGVAVAGASAVATVAGVSRSGQTDATGRVLLTDVLVGTGDVEISRESFFTKSVPVTVSTGQTTDLGVVVLERVRSATGGVLTTSSPPAVVEDAGRTLEFSIQVVVVNEDSLPIGGLAATAFTLHNCDPDGGTTAADCVAGPVGFDAAYTVLGPGTAPSFEEIPGGAPQPYAAVLLFDQSSSIRRNDPTDARLYSAKEFLGGLSGSDVGAMAAFAYGQDSLIPEVPVTIYPVGAPAFFSDGTELFADVDSLADLEGGSTPLYEALCRSMDFAAAQAPGGVRQAVVVFTDGENNVGAPTEFTCRTLDQTIQRSQTTGVDMFTVGLSGEVDGRVLATLADAGNGVFLFAEDVSQLIPIYGSLGNLLSGSLTSYRLTFRIGAAADGTFQSGRSVLGRLSVDTGTNPVELPFVVRIF